MRHMFQLTKGEQRFVIVILLILVAIAVFRHYRDAGPTPAHSPSLSPAFMTSPSATPGEPVELDEVP